MPLFCAECGGKLKHVDWGYKCTSCGKKYPKVKSDNKKE